ncbi:DUF2255 family protein [Actinoplanes solisilvae]|uniref:DUF2255 family protein n=1 Tax=Actinoplanes solisilvae TaxID=2486853 RepID=UPI000FDB7914|nr:DUF2255 family protein [Actinoplanes solisilvae]
MTWPAEALELIGAARELRIPRPIWVVRVGDEVYVRTWYRRDTGWYGHAVATGLAHISVPGLEADVTVTEFTGLRAEIDAAYQAKYGDASMITDAAADTTLRLRPAL